MAGIFTLEHDGRVGHDLVKVDTYRANQKYLTGIAQK